MARKPNLDNKPWTIMKSLATSQGLLTAISLFGRKTYIIFCDNAGTCHSFRKGSSKCLYTWTVLKALDDVASGTISIVSVEKQRDVLVMVKK